MTIDRARELRRSLDEPSALCTALGLEPSRLERWKWKCPRHGGASLSVRRGRDRTIQVRCFGCDFTGDAFTLIAEARGFDLRTDFPKVLEEAAQIAGRWDLVAPERGAAKVVPIRRPAPPPAQSERDYPPVGEVAALWAACRPVTADAEATVMLAGRALDVERIDDLSLARVLPAKLDAIPAWARFGGRSWAHSGHRLVLPVYDANGTMRSVRAWCTRATPTAKRVPPLGHRAGGVVLADPLAVAMLAGAEVSPSLRLVVTEGEPDFLTWATRFSDADPAPPLVIGVVAGAWTPELAARIPRGAEVIIRTHHDDAGNRYARDIHASLFERCTVLRSRPVSSSVVA